jgi:hypothetical protein
MKMVILLRWPIGRHRLRTETRWLVKFLLYRDEVGDDG